MSRRTITRGYSFNATIRYFEADGTTPINLPTGGDGVADPVLGSVVAFFR